MVLNKLFLLFETEHLKRPYRCFTNICWYNLNIFIIYWLWFYLIILLSITAHLTRSLLPPCRCLLKKLY